MFVFSLSLIPQCETYSDTLCIQNDYQKVAIVSNSMRGGEIFANDNKDSSNSFLNNDNISNTLFTDKLLLKNPTRYNRVSIHNLSTNKQKTISIRAP